MDTLRTNRGGTLYSWSRRSWTAPGIVASADVHNIHMHVHNIDVYDMGFKIKIKEPAEKWLRKYDREIQKRFATKIRKLEEHPDLHGKPLRGVLHGYWELYFENKFRILYTIDYKERTVTIEAIKHKDYF